MEEDSELTEAGSLIIIGKARWLDLAVSSAREHPKV